MSNPVRGFLTIDLRLEGNHSLKGKRQVVKSLKDRLHNRFNVAVAELPPLEDPGRAVLGLVTLAGDREPVERTLRGSLVFVEESYLAQVTDSSLELW